MNLYHNTINWIFTALRNLLHFLLGVVEAALTKFSKVNMVQYIALATLIAQTYFDKAVIGEAWLLIITGILMGLAKWHSSTTTLVETGFNKMGWAVYASAAIGILFGFADLIFANGTAIATMFPSHEKIALGIYLGLNILFRTGFSNQPKV